MNARVVPPLLLDAIDRRLVDDFQRDAPVTASPYAAIGAALGIEETDVIARLQRLIEAGAVSRFGAVARPHAAGASTLAALAARPDRLDEIAARVSAFAGVTHNYAREHAFNLWFVVTGATKADVAATLLAIEAQTGLAVLDLPMERAFHIDLGFRLFGERGAKANVCGCKAVASVEERALLAAMEKGLPPTPRPFAHIAARLGWSEEDVLTRLAAMLASGVASRFGVIVKHRAFGYRANAMAVWDLDDDQVDQVAEIFAREPSVTLCYRRPRRLPDWRYNLFCMIHATDRAAALAVIDSLKAKAGAALRDNHILFSTRCYKQRGASFGAHDAERAR
mgnify:CR=1 FL=1